MVGSIKNYTPNFKFIIPDFNIATWHDYIETNFRNIDAILQQIYVVTNYQGAWESNTTYNKNDVVFIAEDVEGSTYVSTLFQIVHDGGVNTTGYRYFSEMYEDHPDYYEQYLTISDAVEAAEKAIEAAQEATEAASAISTMIENLTANRVVITDNSKNLASSITTATELSYVHGVTSSIQNQLDAKIDSVNAVRTTGSQNISGIKTFTDVINFNGGTGTAEGGKIRIAPINNNNNDYSGGYVDVWAINPDDEATHCIRLRMEDSSGLKVYKDGHAEVASPISTSNNNSIATTAWVINKINAKLAPNVSSRVTITNSIGTSDGYTAPSNGFITAESTTGKATVRLIVNSYILAEAYNYNGDSHGHQQSFLCCPIGRGQTVKYTRDSSYVAPSVAYFIPYA